MVERAEKKMEKIVIKKKKPMRFELCGKLVISTEIRKFLACRFPRMQEHKTLAGKGRGKVPQMRWRNCT